jgi:hypothetical protein
LPAKIPPSLSIPIELWRVERLGASRPNSLNGNRSTVPLLGFENGKVLVAKLAARLHQRHLRAHGCVPVDDGRGFGAVGVFDILDPDKDAARPVRTAAICVEEVIDAVTDLCNSKWSADLTTTVHKALASR